VLKADLQHVLMVEELFTVQEIGINGHWINFTSIWFPQTETKLHRK